MYQFIYVSHTWHACIVRVQCVTECGTSNIPVSLLSQNPSVDLSCIHMAECDTGEVAVPLLSLYISDDLYRTQMACMRGVTHMNASLIAS